MYKYTGPDFDVKEEIAKDAKKSAAPPQKPDEVVPAASGHADTVSGRVSGMIGAFGNGTGQVPVGLHQSEPASTAEAIKKDQEEKRKILEKLEAEKKKITDGFLEKLDRKEQEMKVKIQKRLEE